MSDWNPTTYDARHGFVHGLAGGVVELLAPRPGERILDAGSGTGHLAAQIAASGASVLGVDASPAMVAAARAAYPALRFEVADLRTWRTPESFDAAFSNATLHWILQPSAAIDTLARVLRPGGRLVVEFGGHGNVARLTDSLRTAVGEATGRTPPPFWYFPALGAYCALLESHGLAVTEARLFERPTALAGGEGGLAAWYDEFCRHVLEPVPAAARAGVLARAEALARDRWLDGRWVADYVRLRVRAVRRPPGGG